MENPVKMDNLGVPLFLETSIYCFFMASFASDLETTLARFFRQDLQYLILPPGFGCQRHVHPVEWVFTRKRFLNQNLDLELVFSAQLLFGSF